MSQPLIEIRNLHCRLEEDPSVEILRGVNLTINAGEVHSIMGPNGSGKSTLSSVIAGHEAYEVTEGEVLFKGEDILEMDPEERAQSGIFLAFQYPVEIPGVSNTQFLKAAINAKRKSLGEEEIDAMAFVKLAREKAKEVNVPIEFLKRSINEGFSGGEKKRFEIFQMAMLDPKFCILDETDSGLDIDALQIVSEGVNKMRAEDRAFLVITHYQRLLNHIVPDFVHVFVKGQVVESGGKELALDLEANGYDRYLKALATA